jgi:hypothetical protein
VLMAIWFASAVGNIKLVVRVIVFSMQLPDKASINLSRQGAS